MGGSKSITRVFDRIMQKSRPSSDSAAPPTVLVPLYIYPDPHKWDPLFEAIENHSSLNFLIIVNPNSGPGTPVPDDEYITEMTRLNNYANVRTVGYISTDWSKRALSAVLQDIKTYKAWPEAYAVSGVFFDETSWEYDAKTANFLKTINSAVRHARMGFGQDATIIHNPGCIPDKRLMSPASSGGPTITVTFESAYEDYLSNNTTKLVKDLPFAPAQLATVLHSLPETVTREHLRQLVRELKSVTAYVFITDLAVDVYCSFGRSWLDFVSFMAEK